MKAKKIKTLFVFVITCMLFSNSVMAQKQIPVDETLKWTEKTSKTKTIEFEVKKGTDELEMKFEGVIDNGSLKLYLRNPEGYKASGFSLVCSESKHTPSGKAGIATKAERERDRERERARERSNAKSNTHNYSFSSNISSNSSGTTSSSSSSTSISTNTDSDNEVSVDVNVTNDKGDKKVVKIKRHDKSVIKTESNENGARGVMVKNIDNPEPGIWTITIHLEDVRGTLKVEID